MERSVVVVVVVVVVVLLDKITIVNNLEME
jgi:hypothetical protein